MYNHTTIIPSWSYQNVGQILFTDCDYVEDCVQIEPIVIEIENDVFTSFYNDLFRGGVLEDVYNFFYNDW